MTADGATIKDLAAIIGRTATYADNGLNFSVQITDAKQAYGNLRVQIVPCAGTGSRWVNADKVHLQ